MVWDSVAMPALSKASEKGEYRNEVLRSLPKADTANSTESISIILPTYNESDNIESVVKRIQESLSGQDYEVIIVDDDSPDNTWRIAELLYQENDHIQIHRRTEDKGLAKAVAYGFEHSTKEFIAVIDADLQHPPEQIPVLLRHASSDIDLVIGSRYTDFGRIEDWPIWRHIVSRGATRIAKTVLSNIEMIEDPLSGFFIVRRDIVDPSVISPSGYKILLELLLRCDYEGVYEVPYVFTDREAGESNLTVGECVEFLKHLTSLREAVK